MAVKLDRECDFCTEPAIADVKLNLIWGGSWGYVCNNHFAYRAGDTYVTLLERES